MTAQLEKNNSQIRIQLLQKIQNKKVFEIALQNLFSQAYFKTYEQKFNSPILIFSIKSSSKDKNWIIIKSEQEVLSFLENFSQQNNWFLKKFKKLQNILKNIRKKKQQKLQMNYDQVFNQICAQKQIMVNTIFLSFIQYQKFIGCNSKISKSFFMLKQSGGRYNQNKCCKIGAWMNSKKRRQVCLQVNGVVYKNQKGDIRQFMPFNHGFQYFYGKPQTNKQFGIILLSNHRRLILQAQNITDFLVFLLILKKLVKHSPHMSLNRFYSFAPIRYKNKTKFYVDGKDYFQQVSQAIQQAKKSIFITGWMISPEFLLQRGQNKKSLQNVLKLAADNQVKIYILVYWESNFLPNDSAYVKKKFSQISQNIHVIRHPNSSLPVLWSHHSKMIIIDNLIAFFGGLDLCYGRYDDQNHQLFQKEQSEGFVYPGIQYNNARVKDITNVRQYAKDHVQRVCPRLPWHDIGQCVQGQIVQDFVSHFAEIWNFTSYQSNEKINQQIVNNVTTEIQVKSLFTFGKIQSQEKVSQNFQSQISAFQNLSNGFKEIKKKGYEKINYLKNKIFQEENQKMLEKAYRNKQNNQKENNFKTYLNEVKRQVQEINQKINSKKKQFQKPNFTQRSSLQKVKNSIKIQKNNNSNGKRTSLLAGDNLLDLMEIQIDQTFIDCLQNLSRIKVDDSQYIKDEDVCSDDQQDKIIFQKLLKHDKNDKNLNNQKLSLTCRYQNDNFQCQLTRSVGNWSIGCNPNNTQFSIHIAYIQLISQAKFYIYIENQFFISSTHKNDLIRNQIANALIKRIKVAHQNKEIFRVYIMLPLLPGFAGDLLKQQCKILRMVMEYHYKTINGLIEKLEHEGINSDDYIQFYSLRNHGKNKNGEPFTQIIYIHSKLMIVDDNEIICGSANINDRSLLGDRDSQIAVITHQDDMLRGLMNGQNAIISQNGKNLRIKLWMQHFGVSKQIINDPISKNTWQSLKNIAKSNTNIYRTVFGCYPDNQIQKLKQIQQLKNQARPQRYDELKGNICGHAVQYPYNFLIKDKVQNSVIEMEYYLPAVCLV